MDTYEKLQSLHSAEKLRMIKKINTAYNGKTIPVRFVYTMKDDHSRYIEFIVSVVME